MRRTAMVAALAAALMVAALPAGAVIDEQVAAYCGGHDDLSPPGLSGRSNPTADNFAKPVLSNGVVIITDAGPPPDAEIGTSPAAKFTVGTVVLIDGVKQPLGDPVHNSTHCPAVTTILP